MFNFDEANQLGKQAADTFLRNCTSVAKGLQLLATEATDYSRKAYEDGAAAAEKLAGARSVENAFEIQADYARSAYESFVAEATRMSEIYADLAKDAYRPYEAAATKAAG